ncbi:GET complex subunit get1 [Maublancomyces gigas]|uniref:GET complex subunit get1 n=1 Tax=Discina gigas TaxID=1032678 RepID=A0ABR3GRV7_9PEZI
MVSLLALVVILAVVTHIVNTIGAQQINNLLWSLYNFLPISPCRADVASQRGLQREVVASRTQLRATSSQDEFAKWAKLRRTLDKKVADLEQLTASISSARQQFDSKTRILRWILTSGLRILIQFWYTREAVFWIPGGWVPGYVEWGLSFPKAPIGSVSIQVWSFAVGQVVTLLSGLVAYVFALFAARFMAPRLVPVLEEEEEEVKSI